MHTHFTTTGTHWATIIIIIVIRIDSKLRLGHNIIEPVQMFNSPPLSRNMPLRVTNNSFGGDEA